MNLLFISHDATLTGAPTLLINLIRLIKTDASYSIKVIIKKGAGGLINDFKKEADVLVWKNEGRRNIINRAFNKLTKLLKVKDGNHKKIQNWINDSDVIISNTITNGDFLQAFDFSKAKLIVSYIHELEIATRFFSTKQDVVVVKEITNRFLVPSKAVAAHLVNNLQIPEKNISILNYYIPLVETPVVLKEGNRKKYIVGLIGTLDWRKGSDILAVIVSSFFRKHPAADLMLVWKGADTTGIEYERVAYELCKLNLADKVKFEPSSKEVNEFYKSIDVLLLLSKEDPYPLVVLEAANNGKPCICFKDAGGAPEFVKDDAGNVIPYLDIEQLTDSLFDYYNNRSNGVEKGKVAHSRFIALHSNKNLILNQFKNALKSVD